MKIARFSALKLFLGLALSFFAMPAFAMELTNSEDEQDRPSQIMQNADGGRHVRVVDVLLESGDYSTGSEGEEEEEYFSCEEANNAERTSANGAIVVVGSHEPVMPPQVPVSAPSFWEMGKTFISSMRPSWEPPAQVVPNQQIQVLPGPAQTVDGQNRGTVVPYQQPATPAFPLLAQELPIVPSPTQPVQPQQPAQAGRPVATLNILGFQVASLNVDSPNLNAAVGGATQTAAQSALQGAGQGLNNLFQPHYVAAPIQQNGVPLLMQAAVNGQNDNNAHVEQPPVVLAPPIIDINAMKNGVNSLVSGATRAAVHGAAQGGTDVVRSLSGQEPIAEPLVRQPQGFQGQPLQARVVELDDNEGEVPLERVGDEQQHARGGGDGAAPRLPINLDTLVGGAKKIAKGAAEGAREGLEGDGPLWKRIMPSKSNLIIGSAIAAGLIIIGVLAYKYFTHRLDLHLNKPKFAFTLIHPEPYFIESHEKEPWFKGLVFAPDVKERLNEILITTGKIHQRIQDGEMGATYRNYLFYGPPDSDQQKFVQQLAQYAQMDLYEIHASSLTMDDADAKVATEEFFKNEAGKSLNGAIVYIDDATALFSGDAESVNQSKMVAAFIEAVKRPNNKFMVILGTPVKPRFIDRRIDSFLHEWIEIKLPGVEERVKALTVAKKKYLLSDEFPNESFLQSVHKNLSEAKIREIAQKLVNATVGSLFRLIETIKARSSSVGLITTELVDQAVSDLNNRIPRGVTI